MNGITNFYYLLAIIFTSNVLVGCKSTDTNSKGWNIEMGDCQSRTHPTKTNPTADYKACSFNHNQVTDEVNICMLNQGWSEMHVISCSKTNRFYSSEQINGCLNASNESSKINHEKMNSCLAKFEEYEVDSDKTKATIKKVLDERTN
ncbi:hypothetical protein [Shewanella sp. 10N.286.54.B9]|uniref:hypothetical protein n=1 Tax=Shewanella sp. 10N.286.54.B9 TaxID=3229719 RepID=UPI0035507837